MLMDGLRGFIPEQNKITLETALAKLKEDLDYDGVKINQISMALYIFQDAVNSALRSHSIKPHWMFALDNLVRAAVQAAVTILSPELGPHLANPPSAEAVEVPPLIPPPPIVEEPEQPMLDGDGASTSGVSTVNSVAGGGAALGHNGGHHGQHHNVAQLHHLREENNRLMHQLLEMQQNYQDLLRHNLSEQRLHFQAMAQSMQDAHQLRRMWSNATSADPTSPRPDAPQSATSDGAAAMASPSQVSRDVEPDAQMVDWLKNLNLNQEAIQKVLKDESLRSSYVVQSLVCG